MLIYTPQISARIQYIFRFVFDELLGINYVITDNLKIFERANQPKLLYSQTYIQTSALFLKASPLLFETGIKNQNIEVFAFKKSKAFFKTDKHSFFGFDIFAASFYLLSRYEEYLPYTPDKFGRFPAHQSLAVKHLFIEQPVINLWVEYFKTALLKHYSGLKFKQNKFRFLSTIDIDNAYAYLHKGFLRSILSFIKLFITLNFSELVEKTAVHLHLRKDPYDTYDYLIKIQKKYDLQVIYFFLTANYGKYDKNISPKGKTFKKLVKKTAEKFFVGIHPSFASNKYPGRLKKEKIRLEKLTGQKIIRSRQHFLILKMPETYQNLIKSEIKEDYSMGFAETPGFRAGTCTPFFFFDLTKNREEDLKIIPFSVMDVGLKDYKKYNTLQAEEKIKKIVKNVKKVNGLFVSLWHNESLGTKKRWNGWKTVFQKMIELAQNTNGNQIPDTKGN